MKKIVSIPNIGDRRFKKWAKLLSNVDQSKTNGYAFEGEFLRFDRKYELEIGTIVLCYGESGSAKYHYPEVRLCILTEDGWKELFYRDNLDKAWALDVRDEIARLMDEAKGLEPPNPLAACSDEELLDEVKRRGLI